MTTEYKTEYSSYDRKERLLSLSFRLRIFLANYNNAKYSPKEYNISKENRWIIPLYFVVFYGEIIIYGEKS